LLINHIPMNLSRLFIPGLSLILFSGLFVAGISSCRHNDDISGIPEICFEGEILPIFQSNCTMSGCHSSSGEGMDLTTYTGIMQGVSAGNAMQSRVYTALTKVWSGEGMMPPDRPVSLQNRSKIKVWIEQGAKQTTAACP
jgi:hypothetical protein